jgi:hypothetical protein
MNSTLTALAISLSLFATVALGIYCRKLLPRHHLNKVTREAVTLAMGLVATMAALLLGLLVNSAKGTYDANRNEVIQMAAKVAYMDRSLALYGPETNAIRKLLRDNITEGVRFIWQGKAESLANFTPDIRVTHDIYEALNKLAPVDDTQRIFKAQAMDTAAGLGRVVTLLRIQAVPSISVTMLVVVVSWLLIIFFSFTLFSPANLTATMALFASALSVSGAIFLILELDHPFGGLIKIPVEPMLNALAQLAK